MAKSKKRSHKKTILASLPEEERKELISKMRSVNAKKQWDKKRRLDAEAKRRGIYEEYLTWDKATKETYFARLISANTGYETIRAQDFKNINNFREAVENYDEAMNERNNLLKQIQFMKEQYPSTTEGGSLTERQSDILDLMEFVAYNASPEYLKDLMWSGFEETSWEFLYTTTLSTRNIEMRRWYKMGKFWEQRVKEVQSKATYVHVNRAKRNKK